MDGKGFDKLPKVLAVHPGVANKPLLPEECTRPEEGRTDPEHIARMIEMCRRLDAGLPLKDNLAPLPRE